MNSHVAVTYSPYSGEVYSGDRSGSNMGERMSTAFAGHRIARIGVRNTPVAAAGTGAHSAATATRSEYSVKYGSKYRGMLEAMAAQKEIKDDVFSEGYSAPALARIAQLEQQSAAVSEEDQSFITLVPLFREVLGKLQDMFPTENIFKLYNTPTLQGRLPAMDAFRPQMQLNPGDELDFARLRYSEDRFDLKPNVVALMQFQESRIRASIDPLMLDTDAASWALRWGREMMAVYEIQAAYQKNRTTVKDMTASNSSGFPRSGNNPKEELTAVFAEHMKDHKAVIDMTVWNVADFVTYESNFYNMGLVPKDVQGWGILDLPGFGGRVRACVSVFAPRGYVYALDSRSLAKGDGPYMQEMWREPRNRADALTLTDYVQFVVRQKESGRYGFRLGLDGVAAGAIYKSLPEMEAEMERQLSNGLLTGKPGVNGRN